jgi:divalent metal cation (Fe/Co/Zn/Cd) transporter
MTFRHTAGSVTFIEFHLIVCGQMAIEDAHVICDRIDMPCSQGSVRR